MAGEAAAGMEASASGAAALPGMCGAACCSAIGARVPASLAGFKRGKRPNNRPSKPLCILLGDARLARERAAAGEERGRHREEQAIIIAAAIEINRRSVMRALATSSEHGTRLHLS